MFEFLLHMIDLKLNKEKTIKFFLKKVKLA